MDYSQGLFIKGTSKTPDIEFTPGVIKLSGRSIPEDAVAFYEPLIRWIENYLEKPQPITKVLFKIEYINSGSNRYIYNMLKLFNDSFKIGLNIRIEWHYEEDDDTIKNLGLDFQALLDTPINLVIIT